MTIETVERKWFVWKKVVPLSVGTKVEGSGGLILGDAEITVVSGDQLHIDYKLKDRKQFSGDLIKGKINNYPSLSFGQKLFGVKRLHWKQDR